MLRAEQTLVVDVAIRVQPLADRVSRIKGDILIDTGDPTLDARIWKLFRQATVDARELLGGPMRDQRPMRRPGRRSLS